MTTIEIIFLIIALTFIVLVVFLAYVSVAVIRSLKDVNHVLNSLRSQLDELDRAPRILLDQVNEFSANLNHKMKCLDPIFNTISNVSEKLQSAASRQKDSALLRYLDEKINHEKINENPKASQFDTVSDGIELALRGINLWQKLKNRS